MPHRIADFWKTQGFNRGDSPPEALKFFLTLGLVAWLRKARLCTTKHKVAERHGEEISRCEGQEEVDHRYQFNFFQKSGEKKATAAASTATVVKKKAPKPPKKKGVRRATISSGVRKKAGRKLGRSRVPQEAPLAVIFQNDMQAQEAFALLGIQTIRELEEFDPDELVRRLSSPAKQTVGRIRKMLALNNRCLATDEAFALEFQERLSQNHLKLS